ncbi:MAG: ferrous iron transport protein A [Treponema sp.]|nr:ferrous iron transport protein A [Treponema sp.]
MPLLFASIGDEVTIKSIGGAPDVKQHLVDLGFTSGATVTIIQKVTTGLIVKVKEARIALDKGMASKVLV